MKFRMVHRIIDWQERKFIRGVKTVSFEEYNLKAGFGDEPSLPQSLLIESLFQLSNWLVMLSTDFTQMALVIRTQEINFLESPGPGQTLSMEVEATSFRSDGIIFNGIAFTDGREIANGKGCLATPVDLEDFYNPDDLRVLFSEIYRPEADAVGQGGRISS